MKEKLLELVIPDKSYRKEYIKMIKGWLKYDAEILPWFVEKDLKRFYESVEELNNYSKGINVPRELVPSTTYWIKLNKSLIGAVNIRHRLNDTILKYYGQIGYAITPSKRHKGYATQALRLTLLECEKLKIKKVLICCDKKNEYSAKVILNNGGILENEILDIAHDKIIQRYWIDI